MKSVGIRALDFKTVTPIESIYHKRPAAAVIPAPIAYIKVVAVKKLVVVPWALK